MAPKTPEEIAKAKAVAAAVEAQFKMKDNHTNLRTARLVLLIVAICELIFGLWQGFGPMKLMLGFYIEGAFALAFFGLYLLSEKYSVAALLAALLVYLLPQLLYLVFYPAALFSGALWKLLVIIALVSGLVAATKIPKDKSESKAEVLDDDNLV
jgi:predicted anti-sigma-YlaC factor YlaD